MEWTFRRLRNLGLPIGLILLLLLLHCPRGSGDTLPERKPDASALLAAAKAEMVPLPERLMTTTKYQLTAQVLIQEAGADPRQSAERARQLSDELTRAPTVGNIGRGRGGSP